MAGIVTQKDLVVTLKRETLLHVEILCKVQSMPAELSRQVYIENALEKLTQNVFNQLSYYLLSFIDQSAASALPWPIYDTKTERTYRNELSNIITVYSNKGLLSPVMSSYLVNPACYKVTYLVFQLSILAVQRALTTKMSKDHQKSLYCAMTEKYKVENVEEYIKFADIETEKMNTKISSYLRKRQTMEKIAELFRIKIIEIENKLKSLKTQKYLDELVNGFVEQQSLDDDTKSDILTFKNIDETPKFINEWLSVVDKEITNLETEWEHRTSSFLNLTIKTRESTEALIARHTGEADRKMFQIEYNHKFDDITSKDLQSAVNSEQKYVLKNIVKDEKLNFPNLIRGFMIAMCFILKDMEMDDEIYRYNKHLGEGRNSYSEIVSAMRLLVDRVLKVEQNLKPTLTASTISTSIKDVPEIPPHPDLSDLCMNRDYHMQSFQTFTPMNYNKHQFNLNRKTELSFAKPLPKSFLITPFHHAPREDFMKSIISCRISGYDHPNPQNIHNVTAVTSQINRGNETIADCTSGFTKQQLCRLLSTKKSSSTKKYIQRTERPSMKIKKGGLFNESTYESMILTRCHSSPNLFENREKRSFTKSRVRKLSIMSENSPSLLEVSGIAALERESNHSTPQGIASLETSRKLVDSSSMPTIPIETKIMITDVSDNIVIVNNEIRNEDLPQRLSWKEKLEEKRDSIDIVEETKPETPKTNAILVNKTSSLEKIINRFKKVRASVLPMDVKYDYDSNIRPIKEEKETFNAVNVDIFEANRNLLPDLLSPSCSTITSKSNDYLDQLSFTEEEKPRKPRESLGTMLGVDHTFLDQFDLID